ncbi:MAG: hypothetical protein ACXVAJ_07935, partial [Parachlamydiaceae bacterium]
MPKNGGPYEKIVVLLFPYVLSFPAFALPNIDCDPNADCSVNFGFGSADNPVCVAARAACRVKCGNLNDDANRYQSEDHRKIVEIDNNLQQNNDQQNKINNAINNENSSIQQKKQNCSAIETIRQNYLNQAEQRAVFLNQLSTVVESTSLKSSDLITYIKANSSFTETAKAVFISIITESQKNNLDLKTLISQYKTNQGKDLDSVVSTGLNQASINCDQELRGLDQDLKKWQD